jgi:hypothetical protein
VEQIVGSVILAGGAFFGVWKGAVYAVDRLSAQLGEERALSEERLDAEGERLQRQLDAEAERLGRQLAHDRWMREVEELRRLIDDAAETGLAAGNAVHELREPLRQEIESGDPGDDFPDEVRRATSAVQSMHGLVERLELRLGRGHRVPTAFAAWQSAIEEALEYLESSPATRDLLRKGGDRLKVSSHRYLAFMDAARDYVRLDPPGDTNGSAAG